MGCFWGAERIFWSLPGVITTAVGYQGGITPNPTYEEVCSGATGHAEVALVVYDPTQIEFEILLKHFWEQHDPTTLNQQGNDRGTQYRSAIYWTDPAQRDVAVASMGAYQAGLTESGYGTITTEIAEAGPFTMPRNITSSTLQRILAATATTASARSNTQPQARSSIRRDQSNT